MMRHKVSQKALLKDSYYNDIIKELNKEHPSFSLLALGSANYIDFYQATLEVQVTNQYSKYRERFGSLTRLNGGVYEFYNPFRNSLISANYKQQNTQFIANGQLVAPFLFTQSGVKPITAIEVSCRYAELYYQYQQADAIVVVIGFNFNSDDSHINTIFRDLVEQQSLKDLVEKKVKHLICLSIEPENKTSIKDQEQALCEKLRINQADAIKLVHVVVVDHADCAIAKDDDDDDDDVVVVVVVVVKAKTLWRTYIIEQLPKITNNTLTNSAS